VNGGIGPIGLIGLWPDTEFSKKKKLVSFLQMFFILMLILRLFYVQNVCIYHVKPI
jgi:hypothetical protein